jgi:RNA polymerase sigma-70 factor (ECF subfamily)
MKRQDFFEILIRENERHVWAFLRSAVDASAAEDLFQQTCLAAWSAMDRYDRTRPFGPWLRGIASRILWSHLRASGGTVPLDEAALEALGARFDRCFDRRTDDAADRLDALRDCVERLPDEGKVLVDDYYRDGMSCMEIAAKRRESVDAVKKRLQRTREALAACVDAKLAGAIA